MEYCTHDQIITNKTKQKSCQAIHLTQERTGSAVMLTYNVAQCLGYNIVQLYNKQVVICSFYKTGQRHNKPTVKSVGQIFDGPVFNTFDF